MKTNSEHFPTKTSGRSAEERRDERGNALIYVLIAIVLFAALSFTMTRNSDNSEASALGQDRVELYSTQLITYAAQVQSVIDQMTMQGANIDNLDFTLPSEADFNDDPVINKVYHPQGGGLIPATLSPEAMNQISSSPPAGWYLGRFSNVEWTPSAQEDVILTAYQISRAICENINLKVTGSNVIPAITGDMNNYLIVDGSNLDFAASVCPACEGYPSLCVSNVAQSAYSFYSIIAPR